MLYEFLFFIIHRYLQSTIENLSLDDQELNIEFVGFLNGLRRDLQRAWLPSTSFIANHGRSDFEFFEFIRFACLPVSVKKAIFFFLVH